jgi:glycosyltransferase involved in cell wall biosynthesis
LPDVTIAHAGIDSARFAPRDPKPWRRRLLYCGRIDPRKGVGTAIEALARLPADANLVIDGDGDPGYLSELRTLARRLGVTDRVRFQASPSADVSDAYAAADAVVFPVRWREPWGLVPLEAMAVGRPVIATRSGGGPDEYLQHERNCLLVEPGDAAGVAAAFERLEADASLRAAILAAGRETAARFNDARLHEQLLRELDTVAAR